MTENIKKDFIFHRVLFKKGKKTIFDETISLYDTDRELADALKEAFSLFNNTRVTYLEFPNLRRDIFNPNKDDDNAFFINNKDAFFKSVSIDCESARYGYKSQTIQYMNNTFPDWKYLDKRYSLTIELIFDEDGYEKAMQSPDSYNFIGKEERISVLEPYFQREIEERLRFFI